LDRITDLSSDRRSARAKRDSPNDDVVASDGSIWFTDPAYGIGGNYEGMKAEQEQEKHNVYQVDLKSGDIKVVDDDFVEPNRRHALTRGEEALYHRHRLHRRSGQCLAYPRVRRGCWGRKAVEMAKVFAEMPKPSITDGMGAFGAY
jgi:gluconolactonase